MGKFSTGTQLSKLYIIFVFFCFSEVNILSLCAGLYLVKTDFLTTSDFIVNSHLFWTAVGLEKNEPSHEIMALFRPPWIHSSNAHVQTSSGARCLIFGRTLCLLPYLCVRTGKALVRLRLLIWDFACLLCDKYHNLRELAQMKRWWKL